MKKEQSKEIEEKEKRKKRLFILIIAMITIIILLLSLKSCDLFSKPPEKEAENIVTADALPDASGDAKDMSDAEIKEKMQQTADENYFTLTINPEATFENGTSTGSIQIVNAGHNVYPISVDIRLNDTNDLIYQSGAIQPNQMINGGKLVKNLAAGMYQATAKISIYDAQTKLKSGEAEAEMTIIVNH
ncbi:hypothetical protein [Isobaculum melis]|uniref:Uncharacterized protein n=1 Tax=Isobaculum melis TaxID=142588 RepID=A0A1H9TBY1_9LACT|nr:hypothetical protein [Isobaculum melis]SER94547.1 hypothetical protein SAMN04488559_11213 [Isobaculum melis]